MPGERSAKTSFAFGGKSTGAAPSFPVGKDVGVLHRMSSFTKPSFDGQCVEAHAAQRVNSLGYGLQVVRVDARPNAAQMVYHQSIRDRSETVFVHEPVTAFPTSRVTEHDTAVAVAADAQRTHPAIRIKRARRHCDRRHDPGVRRDDRSRVLEAAMSPQAVVVHPAITGVGAPLSASFDAARTLSHVGPPCRSGRSRGRCRVARLTHSRG